MRVIAGSARSLKLKTPPGEDVRPTTDRIKETLFNIINNRIFGAEFLDLFCGSGAIGIEALSRGADSSVFVDNSKISLEYTKENIEHTRLEGSRILRADCSSAVSMLAAERKSFDFIFMDPPYNQGYEKSVLEQLSRFNILKEDGLIIVEASVDTAFDYVSDFGFEVTREKCYGSNKHVFIERKER